MTHRERDLYREIKNKWIQVESLPDILFPIVKKIAELEEKVKRLEDKYIDKIHESVYEGGFNTVQPL